MGDAGDASTQPEGVDFVAMAESVKNNKYYQNFQPKCEVENISMGDPANRRIRIINVGTGMASINLAYYLHKHCQNFELTMLEKSGELGGVWNLNRYPGLTCDLPSHAYQLYFAPNPDWPQFLSPGATILSYFKKVCEVFNLQRYMKFNSEVLGARWDPKGVWVVQIRHSKPDGTSETYEQEAELLVNNSGNQHKWGWPDFEGLDKYKGKLIHTGGWDKDFWEEAWKGKKVAVIGNGSSAVQVVPAMQPHCKEMKVYCRTPAWFTPHLYGHGNFYYTDKQRQEFRQTPEKMIEHMKSIENDFNNIFAVYYNGSEAQRRAIEGCGKHMSSIIKDKALLKALLPRFAPGCRRINVGEGFLRAVQEENTEVIFKGVKGLTETGVIDADGVEREADCVVCATGYIVDLAPTFDIVGADSVSLKEKFRETPESYLGVAIPGFPNYFFGIGPYWPTANGPITVGLIGGANYVVAAVKKLQLETTIKCLTPTKEATEEFVDHAQSWEDYKIEYFEGKNGHPKNRFAYLGNGTLKEASDGSGGGTAHISLDGIDPVWANAVGIEMPV
ncbi:hypothetical protein CLAIMM_12618 [Cladophialophora immunda]|nr:hypothetical protein CLAIMM_12618 [Cladophialophora immunda]